MILKKFKKIVWNFVYFFWEILPTYYPCTYPRVTHVPPHDKWAEGLAALGIKGILRLPGFWPFSLNLVKNHLWEKMVRNLNDRQRKHTKRHKQKKLEQLPEKKNFLEQLLKIWFWFISVQFKHLINWRLVFKMCIQVVALKKVEV